MSFLKESLNVAVADVQPIIRWALQHYLPAHCHARVAYCSADFESLLQRVASKADIDVVIIEMALPRRLGSEIGRQIERLKTLQPGLRVLIYSFMAAPFMAQAALKSGAHAYVCKRSPLSVLRDALVCLRLGENFIDPKLRQQRSRGRVLSPAETDIVWRLAHGATVSEIADCTERSVSTVSTHKRNAMLKMGITTDSQLVLAGLMDWMGES